MCTHQETEQDPPVVSGRLRLVSGKNVKEQTRATMSQLEQLSV